MGEIGHQCGEEKLEGKGKKEVFKQLGLITVNLISHEENLKIEEETLKIEKD